MRYKELKEILNQLDEEQLDFDVTVLIDYDGEVHHVNLFDSVAPNDEISDVLDPGHPILVVS